MTKLFISYSRKDKKFAERLVRKFAEQQTDVWIDWEDIPPSQDWWNEIKKGIEEADVFVFLVSPDSVTSKVCREEIGHAIANGKRLIPIVVRDVSPRDAPPDVAKLNWVFFGEEEKFEESFGKLDLAIHTDFEWVQFHSEMQNKALEWERHAFEKSLLLRGKELSGAEARLQVAAEKDPPPTELQIRFIRKSKELIHRQRRLTLIGLISIVAFIAGYSIWQDRTWFRVWPIPSACPNVTVAIVEVSPGNFSSSTGTLPDELSKIKSTTTLRRCQSDVGVKQEVVHVDIFPLSSEDEFDLAITLPSTPANRMDFLPEIRRFEPESYTPDGAITMLRASTAYSVGNYEEAIQELDGMTSLAGKILLAQAYLYADELEMSRKVYREILETEDLHDVNPAQLRMGLASTLWYAQVSDEIRSNPDLYEQNVSDCNASFTEYAEALQNDDTHPDWVLIADLGKFYCWHPDRNNMTPGEFVTGNPYQDLLSALILIGSGDVDAQSDLIVSQLESARKQLSIANLELSKFYADRGDCDNYRYFLNAFKATAFTDLDRSTVQYYYYDEKDCWPFVWSDFRLKR